MTSRTTVSRTRPLEMPGATDSRCGYRGHQLGLEVAVSDAATSKLPDQSVDVVLIRRHLAWTLPDPHAALDRWAALLRPAGRLVMVEGRWGAPHQDDGQEADAADHGDYAPVHHALPWYGGVDAKTLAAALAERFARVDYHDLSGEAVPLGA